MEHRLHATLGAPPAAPPSAQPSALAAFARRVRRLAALCALWQRRHTQRRELGELDDRLLRDIGITREQAWREAGKPFWRA